MTIDLTDVIAEVKALAEWDRKHREQQAEERLQEEIRQIECPDCGAKLRLESSEPLPHDITVVFVKHAC